MGSNPTLSAIINFPRKHRLPGVPFWAVRHLSATSKSGPRGVRGFVNLESSKFEMEETQAGGDNPITPRLLRRGPGKMQIKGYCPSTLAGMGKASLPL
ncbi:MAG: hypothetical protein VYA27_07405, partial [Verrucomicrobiota bacterium]|nr:hypothetical protein [Verrucomicrobiota bacterium]